MIREDLYKIKITQQSPLGTDSDMMDHGLMQLTDNQHVINLQLVELIVDQSTCSNLKHHKHPRSIKFH